MKNITLFLIILFFMVTGLTIFAQSDCKDVVHPTNYRASIMNCCIRNIINGNIVVYVDNGALIEIEALAVNYNQQYYNLSNSKHVSSLEKKLHKRYPDGIYLNKDYEYNRMMHSKATTKLVMGTVMATLGAAMLTGGFVIMNNKMQDYPNTSVNGAGFMMMLVGMGGVGAGIPIAIVGGVKMGKYKNEMHKNEKSAKLMLNTTSNGIGLVLNF